MAEKKTEDKVEETEVVSLPNTELKHVGFGRYDVDGQRFESKDDALNYVARKQAEAEDEAEYGPLVPEGYDIDVNERPFIYRGSLMELAMNEQFAPDGSFNKYYDREWVWAWAAHDGTDISDKLAKKYMLVTLDELNKLAKEDKIPRHVLNMVREEGSYLIYGDSVLMRIPRVIRRQQQREKFEGVLRRMKRLDQAQQQAFKDKGVGITDKRSSDDYGLQIRF